MTCPHLVAVPIVLEAMEVAGDVKPGTLQQARRQIKAQSREPVKYVHAIANSLFRGAGIDIDRFVPDRQSPQEAGDPLDLLQKDYLLFLSDGEPKQTHGNDYRRNLPTNN